MDDVALLDWRRTCCDDDAVAEDHHVTLRDWRKLLLMTHAADAKQLLLGCVDESGHAIWRLAGS
ncbi:hypothetical protein Scep_012779 [Stephania cephalantha]|uniref:Uncharacterized protein n=1 Tax=Stephania cephalantha TaxID=152367 RepID=A0AAP0JFM5_9MAGN